MPGTVGRRWCVKTGRDLASRLHLSVSPLAAEAPLAAGAPPQNLVFLARDDAYCKELLAWMQHVYGQPREWKFARWSELIRATRPDKVAGQELGARRVYCTIAFLKEARPWFVR